MDVRSLFDAGFVAASALDMFLRIDGIAGESADSKHAGQIEVESFSWAGDAVPAPLGGGGTMAPPQFSQLRFVSRVNKASPLLMQHLAQGKHIPNADLFVRRAGSFDTSGDFYTIDISDVGVGAYRVSTAEDGTLTEEFTLQFTEAVVSYRPQDAKGGLGTPVTAQWELRGIDGLGGTPLPEPALNQPSLLNEGYAPPASNTVMYLRLDGIEGESTSRGHERQIEVESFSWGASQTGSATSGGMRAGRTQFSELRFVSRVNKASPLLMQRLADGRLIPDGDFFIARTSPTTAAPVVFYRLDFGSAVVSSYHVTTAHDGSMKEEFTLQFDLGGDPPPPPPQVSVSDVTVVEGTGSGTTSATFTVNLSGAATGTVMVNWATANGTAMAGVDYTGASGTLSFLAGETSKTITVAVIRDFLDEPDETFFVNLSAPAGATIGDGQGVGTITDDDEPPPVVTQVFVASSGWRASFLQALAAGGLGDAEFGYAVPDGTAQLRVLPWQNINRVSVRFDKPVHVGEANMMVRGVNGGEYGHAGFEYDPDTFTATLVLKQVARNDKLVLGVAGVWGENSPALDGEWQNPILTSPGDAYPSGDGTAGGTFAFRFNALAGDGNGDGSADALDLVELRRKLRRAAPAGGYSPFYDFSGDGTLNAWDLVAVLRQFNQRLPDAEPEITPPPSQAMVAATHPLRGRPLGRSFFGDTPVLA